MLGVRLCLWNIALAGWCQGPGLGEDSLRTAGGGHATRAVRIPCPVAMCLFGGVAAARGARQWEGAGE